MIAPLQALAELAGERAWLVGGAVRDRLLGRSTTDLDVAVADEPAPLARGLARRLRAHAFELSESFAGWRLVARDRSWQLDLLPLLGETIEQDLAARDFTVNAIAERLSDGELVDPFGGQSDLEARVLRMVAPRAFDHDPARVLRLARLACELQLTPEEQTVATAREAARGLEHVAAERVFGEFKRIVVADAALQGLGLLDRLSATDIILPELAALRGVEQSQFHHLDVHDHTRAVLEETIALTADPGALFAEQADALAALLAEPLANEMTRGQALRFGALLHDIAKPDTRGVGASGRVTFIGHDESGAELAASILRRLKASERLASYVADLVRHHLRLGFLVHETPLSPHSVYRYLRASEPVQVDVTLLSVADRLSTRGRGSEVAITRHLELAREMLGPALQWRVRRPRPPVRGDELARELSLPPGPELGRVLAELEEAAYAGEVAGPAQAIERARELLGRRPAPER